MSTLAQSVIDEAAFDIGDPNYSRIDRTAWTMFLNWAARTMARNMRVVKWRATADIEAANDIYELPDDCVQVTRIQYNPTPDSDTTWRDVHEYFEDEYRKQTNWNLPLGEPINYRMDQGFFLLTPRPSVAVPGGMRIEYWGLPSEVTDASTQDIPFQSLMRDHLKAGMNIRAMFKLEKLPNMQVAEQEWVAGLSASRPQLERRSDDRRSRIRPNVGARRGLGQV